MRPQICRLKIIVYAPKQKLQILIFFLFDLRVDFDSTHVVIRKREEYFYTYKSEMMKKFDPISGANFAKKTKSQRNYLSQPIACDLKSSFYFQHSCNYYHKLHQLFSSIFSHFIHKTCLLILLLFFGLISLVSPIIIHF